MAIFDVYTAFIYYQNETVGKRRPILQVKTSSREPDAFCVITKAPPRNNFPGEIRLEDWQYAGLTIPSTARLSIRVTTPTRYRKIGTLSTTDALSISNELINTDIRERHISEEFDDNFDMKLSLLNTD